MKKFIFCVALFFTAASIYAAPLDRSIREIRDIISSPDLRRFIPPHERILDIRCVDRGYLITTNHFQLLVEVIYPLRGAQAGEEEEGTPTLRFKEPTKVNS
jgi:hypothetical protein